MYSEILTGFSYFIQPDNILAMFCGTALGIIIGAIPGLGVTLAIAVLTPLTFSMQPLTAIVFLLGIYIGGIFGGSITAILINTPGTPAAAATLIDGYPLAKQGKARKALNMALYASVMGNIFGVMALIIIAAQLAKLALQFGPPEYAMLILFSLTIIASMTGKSIIKGLLSAALGLFLCTIGADPMNGTPRLIFGINELADGLNILPLLIGLFAVGEIFIQAEKKPVSHISTATLVHSTKPEDNRVSFGELKSSFKSIVRSSLIGIFIGTLPGIGSSVTAFLSYGMASRYSKNPDQFGKGALEGVAAAESGNNAVCGAALIPLLAFAIPGDLTCAVLLGALMIHGLTPGPLLFQTHIETIYGIFISLAFCSVVLLILGKISFRMFGFITSLPRHFIFPFVLVLCAVGSYSMKNSLFDVYVMFIFGLIGYGMAKGDFPPAPMVIAFILGPMFENHLRQALIMSSGNYSIFITRPVSTLFVVMTVISVSLIIYGKFKGKRQHTDSG